MPSATVTLDLIMKLLPLAIEAFGAISSEVMQLRAAAGLSDEQLLNQAAATDQATLDAIQKHLEELGAADPALLPKVEPATSIEPAPETAATSTLVGPGGVLIHGQ